MQNEIENWATDQATQLLQAGNNLTGVAVQFATQDQQNAAQVQKCIAVFTIKYPVKIYI